MEACGAARIVECLFQGDDDKCYIAHLVTHDDASVGKILSHSFKDMLNTRMMKTGQHGTQTGKRNQTTYF
jgi:hypothetical protein